MGSVRKSLLFAFAQNYTALAVQFVSVFIIARLLSPSELGIFSVAAVMAAVASVVRDFGLGEYLIQEKELTRDKIRAAFTVNLIISWSIAGLFFLLRDLAAEFYREPGVGKVMAVQSFTFLLIPFGAITVAYLRREMDFRSLYWIRTASGLTSASTAITLALMGFSYMSMAWSSLAGSITTFLMTSLFRPRGLPFLPSFKGIRRVISFGTYASGIYIFGQLGKGAPDLILGRALNMEAVGLLGRATGMIELFNRAVMRAVVPVSLPYYATKHRSGESVKEGYLKTVSYITCIGWPFFSFLGLMAYPAIRILYGPQWDAAVPLLKILCVAAAIELTFYMGCEVLIALGQVEKSTRLQFTIQAVRILAILVASLSGLTAVCIAILFAALINLATSHRTLRYSLGVSARDLATACYKSAWLAAAAAVPAIAVAFLMDIDEKNFLLPFLVAAIGSALAWLTAAFASGHPVSEEIRTHWIQLRKLVLSKR